MRNEEKLKKPCFNKYCYFILAPIIITGSLLGYFLGQPTNDYVMIQPTGEPTGTPTSEPTVIIFTEEPTVYTFKSSFRRN